MRIFLLGFMGAGKSYWGKQLASHWNLPYFDLDDVIVEREGMAVAEIFAEKGETYFREQEGRILRELALDNDTFLIACGGGTPCFSDTMDFMNQHGITIWLNPSVPVMVERLQRKQAKRPLIQDLSAEELTAFTEKKLAERQPFYEQSQVIISDDAISLETFDKLVRHA
ncbi:shikimate kinase [Chitinophaga sp. GCM10012297]|uniref:Shikimate kinase n=1 Tax=Chitinophaga chungangae TaxID=2821488 RepID=A0ABS3Y9P1_9BACT|nr:shikimate kinase [Chitinophaga chungangae]MBO9151397.1 shikimate kinase [Chitinophaga chungangae]